MGVKFCGKSELGVRLVCRAYLFKGFWLVPIGEGILFPMGEGVLDHVEVLEEPPMNVANVVGHGGVGDWVLGGGLRPLVLVSLRYVGGWWHGHRSGRRASAIHRLAHREG